MATIANLTIKKSDGTTDIVWSSVNGSAGDKQPAIWRSNTIGGNVAVRPEFRAMARTSGAADAQVRRVNCEFFYPEYYTIDGQQKVVNKCWGAFAFNSPSAAADVVRVEAAYQFTGLLRAITADIYSGYMPS